MADVHKGKRKVQCCTTHSIRTWNVTSMNQGKMKIIKEEMEHLNIAVLGVSELKWTGMQHFQSDNYEVFYSGHDKLRRNGVASLLRLH